MCGPPASRQTFGYRLQGSTRRYVVRRIERKVGDGLYCSLQSPVVNIYKVKNQQVLLFNSVAPFMGKGNNGVYPSYVTGTSTCTAVTR
jgi:hypothetical protein